MPETTSAATTWAEKKFTRNLARIVSQHRRAQLFLEPLLRKAQAERRHHRAVVVYEAKTSAPYDHLSVTFYPAHPPCSPSTGNGPNRRKCLSPRHRS